MSEAKEPVAEAVEISEIEEKDAQSYELAFHVLPTVAEEEVSKTFDEIKSMITTLGGEAFDEEAPERFELAYTIYKNIEGKNVTFTNSYFGWVRFRVSPGVITEMTARLEESSAILRHLLIKLTKIEEATPFRFHEAQKREKVEEDEGDIDPSAEEEHTEETETKETDPADEKSEA